MVEVGKQARAVAAALTVLVLSGCAPAAEQSGLRPHAPDAGHLTTTAVFDSGDVISEGMVRVFPEGDEPIEIVDVRSNALEGDLEYLGAYVAGTDRGTSQQIIRSYPPVDAETGHVEPAEGAVIGPVPAELSEAGYQILLGYRVGEAPQSVRGSVSIDYRVGNGRVRTQEEPVGLVVCTDPDIDCADSSSELE